MFPAIEAGLFILCTGAARMDFPALYKGMATEGDRSVFLS